MKRTNLITATAIIATLAAAPALALDANVGANGGAGAGAQVGNSGVNAGASMSVDSDVSSDAAASNGAIGGSTDAGTTASTSSNANFGMLISSLNAASKTAADVQAMTDVSAVSVVAVSDLEKGANQAAVKNAMSKNAQATADLQAAIEANAALKAELAKQSVDLSSVVAANVGADGQLTVFVK